MIVPRLDQLLLEGDKIHGDLRDALTAASWDSNLDGATSIRLTVRDPRGDWRRSDLFGQRSVVTVDDPAGPARRFELTSARVRGSELVLIFDDVIATALRDEEGYKPADPGTVTRSEFIRLLAHEAGVPVEAPDGDPLLAPIARGTDPATGGDVRPENSWDAGKRLAREVAWRSFSDGHKWIFASDAHLIDRATPIDIRERTGGIGELNWSVDMGQPADQLSFDARTLAWRAVAGQPIRVHDQGPGDGIWLLSGITGDMLGSATRLRGTREQKPLPEPAHEAVTGPSDVALADVYGVAGGRASPDFVAVAQTQAGKPYVYGAEASPSNSSPRAFDCCLVGETLISTTSGPRRIDEIQPGDEVYAWEDGKVVVRAVVAAAAMGSQDVYQVRTRNRTVFASGNHPFLVVRRGGRVRTAAGAFGRVDWRTEWVRADQLRRDDVIVVLDHLDRPGGEVTLPDGSLLTDQAAWLLGFITGDGTVTDSGVNIAVFGRQRDAVRRAAADVWGVDARPHPTHGLIVSSAAVRDLLTDLGLRARSWGKTVPTPILTATPTVRRAYLDGYHAADGHTDARGFRSYDSTSPDLIRMVRQLHIELGDSASNVTAMLRTRPIVIKGRRVRHARTIHRFQVYPGGRRSTLLTAYGMRRAVPDEQLRVERVLGVTPAGHEETYDIEIDGAHSYIADGVVVHNSELVEWALARVGVQFPDGSGNQAKHCQRAGSLISIADGMRTYGALLFRTPNFQPGHVAISRGNGTTIEARGRRYGVGNFAAAGRNWTHAALVPGVTYR